MSALSMTPPSLEIRALEHEPAYALGFPVHVGLELGLDRDSAEVRCSYLDFISTYGGLGVAVHDASGGLAFERRSRQGLDPVEGAPDLWLRSERPRRALVDLSEVLPATLPAGSYQAEVGVLGARPPAWSRPFTLVLREPDDAERDLLAALADQRAPDQTWGEWTSTPPPADFAWPLPPGPRHPLRFSRLLREMLVGPRDLSDWRRAELDVLDGVYAPEREALWAEVLHARGDAALGSHCAGVVRSWPGLTDWIAEVEAGEGPISALRAALRNPGTP